ncbi:hypothetical protein JCM19232_3777 [Vibrio ishigakensis]|uniref:Uncharacterized protein n=1 Tax=Vibrio ishigakensis TaxID=1481914 RepID=A0A0B8P228_9VIBR|nr:hypothetical protein JCM19232_3777 [Vibrio ishigakensis]
MSVVTLLVACGGSDSGDDSGPEPTKTIQGKVIDGYLSGTKIYLDMNNNGKFDESEPSAVSLEAGDYKLDLTESEYQCLEVVPLQVEVPIGAIDEEFGEVTEPYIMTLAPMGASVNGDNEVHITPLTSTAWQGMSSSLSSAGDYSNLTCKEMLEHTEYLSDLKQAYDKALFEMGDVYNISAEQIFADYIANGDEEAHELAVHMVEGFKRTFSETAELLAKGYDVYNYQYIYTAGSDKYEWSREYDWILNYGMNHNTDAASKEYQGQVGFNYDFSESVVQWRRNVDVENISNGGDEGIFLKRGTYLRTTRDDSNNTILTCERLENIEDVWEGDLSKRDFTRYERTSVREDVLQEDDCTYDNYSHLPLVHEYIVRTRNLADTSMEFDEEKGLSSLQSIDIENFSAIQSEIESWNIEWEDPDAFDTEPEWMTKQKFEVYDDRTITYSRGLEGYRNKVTQFSDGTYIEECPDSNPTPPLMPEYGIEYCEQVK